MNIGSIQLNNGILLAPMEEISDAPFRIICKRLGADIVFSEFISSEGLIREAWKSRRKLTIDPEERPIAIQIFGGNIDVMQEAARITEAANPDFIDINCGCWVKNVVARAAGAALLKEPDTMVQMAKTLVQSVRLPVTVKTRLGWDKQSIIIVELAQRLEQEAGISALTIHCRTRDMGHNGSADWSWIEKVKRQVSIPVILNGDVEAPEDVSRAFAQTGCDAVMIGRAAINNPFIFRQAKTYLLTGMKEQAPGIDERIAVCLEHLRRSMAYKGESVAIREFRKFYAGYLRGLYGAAEVRRDLVTFTVYSEIEDRLLSYMEHVIHHCDMVQSKIDSEFVMQGESTVL